MTTIAPPLADLTQLARDIRDVASCTKHAREMLEEVPEGNPEDAAITEALAALSGLPDVERMAQRLERAVETFRGGTGTP